MQPDDTEHPDVLTDAAAIDRAGGRPYVEAIGELTVVLDSLFDGPGNPAYVNAGKEAKDAFYEQQPFGSVRMFTRQFWGSSGASIVAAVGVKNQRPALLSIIALALPLPGARMLDYAGAEAMALALARTRSAAM